MSNYVDNLVWVELTKEDNFLIVKETLTRIGISSKSAKRLTQSCHILHKKGKYAIVHFKELFLLDGKQSEFTEDDKARRNVIIKLLSDWGLIRVVDPKQIESPMGSLQTIKILPSSEKKDWELIQKYTIGNKVQ